MSKAPGGVPGAAPGGAAGGDMGQVIAKLLAELQGGAQGDYVTKVVENMKRTAAVMVAKLDMSHPEVARHMARAWSSLDAALKAANEAKDNEKQKSLAQGPLGFSGASMGTGEQPAGPGAMGAPG